MEKEEDNMMEIRIKVTDEGKATTEMVGEGAGMEIKEAIFQMDLLRFKLLRLLDDDGAGGYMAVEKTEKRR